MKKLVVWICDGVVALMAILAIVCYFFAPVWKLTVKYPLSAEDIQDMVASSVSDVDIEIEKGVDINLDINIDMPLLFSSIGSHGDEVVQKLVDKNVDKLVVQLKGTVGDLTKSVAKQYAKQVVKDQVNDQLKKILNTQDGAEINRKLESAGITDAYISQKTDALFDLISSGNTSVDQLTEEVLGTVDEVYDKLKASGDETFQNVTLNDKDRADIEKTVNDALSNFSDSDGTINLDEYINAFLVDALRGMNGSSSKVSGIRPVAAQTSADDELAVEMKAAIVNMIPSELGPILSIVMIVVLVLILLSMASWVYILVKLIVKLTKFATTEPTVKLKLPIILGWLPFLILVIVPSIAMPLVMGMLGEELAGLAISFSSISWIALMSAVVCLGISIFYMIVRKKNRSEIAVSATEEESTESSENTEEQE